MKVFKYPIKVEDNQYLYMPDGAVPLCVQVQNDKPCIWASVDPSAPDGRPTLVIVRGTGHEYEARDNESYLGTFQLHGGALVFHVWIVR